MTFLYLAICMPLVVQLDRNSARSCCNDALGQEVEGKPRLQNSDGKLDFSVVKNERFIWLVAKVCVCKVWIWVLTWILGSSVSKIKQLKGIWIMSNLLSDISLCHLSELWGNLL